MKKTVLPKGEMELSPDHRLKGDALGIDDNHKKLHSRRECWIANMSHTYFQLFYHLVWSTKNGAFSVSVSNKNAVISYINNQKEHHKGRSFKDEFLILLKQHEIAYEEKYLWK